MITLFWAFDNLNYEFSSLDSLRGILGEGMPVPNLGGQRGNLYVLFEIQFPENHFIPEDKYKVRIFIYFWLINELLISFWIFAKVFRHFSLREICLLKRNR